MKKNQYIAPDMKVTALNVADGVADGTLLTASTGGERILHNGGETAGKVTSSDVKRDSYNVWDDDWSK